MTPRSTIRVYADTSVFGGVFDDEYSKASRTFFEQVRDERFRLVSSAIVRREIQAAPQDVQNLWSDMMEFAELAALGEDVLSLQEAFLDSGIVTKRSATDALHVALATVSGCSMIVSWNFRHIVHYQKIPMYNGVSAARGYPPIAIYSPREVIEYDDQDI